MKKIIFYISHIIECIENIESFSKNLNKKKFSEDILRQSAIIRQLEIIGEAVKNLPIDFTVKYPEIEWTKIAGTRDKIIHHYFGIDLDIIWKIIEKDISVLKKEMKKIYINEKGIENDEKNERC